MTATRAAPLTRLTASIEAKRKLLSDLDRIAVFEAIADVVTATYKSGGRLYIAGNSGFAADAQHLAAEFFSKLARDRAPLAAEALTVDTPILTAIGNDYGFDAVFSRQIEGKTTAMDIFLGITTSGNSRNILEALRTCRKLNIRTIIFSGGNGGLAAEEADYCLLSPSEHHSRNTHHLCARTL